MEADEEDEEAEAVEAKFEMEKTETMQKIKDINKLENRDKDLTLYEHGENIKNNQQKGISHLCHCFVSTIQMLRIIILIVGDV